MTEDVLQTKQRVAAELLAEMKASKGLQWFYISLANERFQGGYIIRAQGITDAWVIFHGLGFWKEGCSTVTEPIPEKVMEKIPESMRWRRLTQLEALALGT